MNDTVKAQEREAFEGWVNFSSAISYDEISACWQAWQARAALAAVPVQETAPGKYDNVLRPFMELMERELHANSRKGDRPGWLSMSREVGLLEIYWHTAKLSAAVKNNDAAAISEHSADVANMAMMLLDVCGGLTASPAAPAEPAAAQPLTDEQCDEIANAAYVALRATGWDGGMGGLQWDRALVRASINAIAQHKGEKA